MTRRPRYDLAEATAHLRGVDPALATVIETVGDCGIELSPTTTVFDRVATAVVGQQLSVAAARTIGGRLRAIAGTPGPDPDRPRLDPAAVVALTDEEIRGCGLSRAKTAALRDLADAVLTGRLPDLEALHDLDDEQVVSALVAIRGIGRWTAEMLLLFLLGRPDVLPIADVGLRRGFERMLELAGTPVEGRATPAQMTDRAEAWRPYRSVATWYLWRILEVVPD